MMEIIVPSISLFLSEEKQLILLLDLSEFIYFDELFASMMTIKEQKEVLRKEMLQKRANINPSTKANYDRWICQTLWQLIQEKSYQCIHCYLPMGAEINIVPLIEMMLENDLIVITPKTLPQRQLEHLELTSLGELEQGVYGTRHPANAEIYTGQYDMIIVPGLAFDAAHHRLGYGGGYYDNFLGKHPSAERLGIFYPVQQVDQVPLEAHDLTLDGVVVGSFA